MRKWLLLLALWPAVSWGQSHEILRPTADVDTATGLCGPVTKIGSGTMPEAWDAAGLATSVTQTTNSTLSANRYKARLFNPWATSAQSGYTNLTINVNSSSPGADSIGIQIGSAVIAYSLNGGTTYTTLESDSGSGWIQRTTSANIAANTPLANIRVIVCTSGGTDGSGIGGDSVTVWDIWTDGTYSAAGGTGITPPAAKAIQPSIISGLIFLCGKLWA